MRTTLVSLSLAAGIGFACCQSAGALSPSATTANERAIVSRKLMRTAWSANATKVTANTARQSQQKGNKGKQ